MLLKENAPDAGAFAPLCAPCHADECARIERNRARRRRER